MDIGLRGPKNMTDYPDLDKIEYKIKDYFDKIEEKNINKYKHYNQIYSEIEKEYKFEKKYKEKLINQFNNISKLKENPSNIQTINYIEELSKQSNGYIISPIVLDPLIYIYEEKINLIEKQNEMISNDLITLNKYLELMVEDNNKLRSYYNKKDQEIKNYLELNLNNDNENNYELKEKNKYLEKEINVLLLKITELNDNINTKNMEIDSSNNDLEKYKALVERIKEDLHNQINITKELTDCKINLENNISILNKKLSEKDNYIRENDITYKKTIDENKNLKLHIEDLNKDYNDISNNYNNIKEKYSNDINLNNDKLRSTKQEVILKDKLIEENNNKINLLTIENSKLSQEKVKYINENIALKDKIKSLEKKNTSKVDNSNENNYDINELNKIIELKDKKISNLEDKIKEISNKNDNIISENDYIKRLEIENEYLKNINN